MFRSTSRNIPSKQPVSPCILSGSKLLIDLLAALATTILYSVDGHLSTYRFWNMLFLNDALSDTHTCYEIKICQRDAKNSHRRQRGGAVVYFLHIPDFFLPSFVQALAKLYWHLSLNCGRTNQVNSKYSQLQTECSVKCRENDSSVWDLLQAAPPNLLLFVAVATL